MKRSVGRVLGALLLLAAAAAVPAQAAELKVLCAGAMRAALQQLAPKFEAASGNKLAIEYTTAGKVEQSVMADQPFDVAILTKPRADRLVKAARMVGGDVKPLARVEIGAAVKAGAPHPDIGSVAAFKEALTSAKSVAVLDPATGATSGIHLAKVFGQLGLAAALKPKLRLVSQAPGQGPPRVGELVARGEAAIGLQPISELQEVMGIDVVGPIPAELQTPDLAFVAGMANFTTQPDAAEALINFLASPAAKATYREKGMAPG